MKKLLVPFLLASLVFYSCSEEVEVDELQDDAKLTAAQLTDVAIFKVARGPYAVFFVDFYGEGKISINYGDGEKEDLFFGEFGINVLHEYKSEGPFFVRISGDLAGIKNLNNYSTSFSSMNIQALVNLEEFHTVWSKTGRLIDLSENGKLTRVQIASPDVQKVVLPRRHRINDFGLATNLGNVSSATLEQMVVNLNNNARLGNIRNGRLDIFKGWIYNEDDPTVFVAPPTAKTLALLKELKDKYGWRVTPDVN